MNASTRGTWIPAPSGLAESTSVLDTLPNMLNKRAPDLKIFFSSDVGLLGLLGPCVTVNSTVEGKPSSVARMPPCVCVLVIRAFKAFGTAAYPSVQ